MATDFILLAAFLLLIVAGMAATVTFIPKFIVKSAPDDIRDKVLARPDYPVWKTVVGWTLTVILLAALIGVLVWAGVDAVRNGMGFWRIFLRFLIILEGYKIFDMVCFDWILLTKLNIFQHFFPETIGCKGYEQFGFNLKSQIAKMFVFAAVAAAVAGVLTIFV